METETLGTSKSPKASQWTIISFDRRADQRACAVRQAGVELMSIARHADLARASDHFLTIGCHLKRKRASYLTPRLRPMKPAGLEPSGFFSEAA
jgi:hypothetical protein